jgi:hypothetical protein
MSIRNDLSGSGPHFQVILHPDPALGNQRPVGTLCSKNFQELCSFVKEVGAIYESASGTIIPDLDPTRLKSTLPDWIRIHFRSTGGCSVLSFLKFYICSCQTLQVFRNLSMKKQLNTVADEILTLFYISLEIQGRFRIH